MDNEKTTVLDEYAKFVDTGDKKPDESAKIASDLSRFDTREEVRRAVRDANAQEAERGGKAEPRARISFGTIFACVFFAALASLMINFYVKQNELSVTLGKLKEQYAEEQLRNTDLQTKFDQRYVLSEIEDYAVNVLGMVKIEANQIEYVEIETPETITKIEDEGEGKFNLLAFLKEKIENILEFLA